jgi:hypothetical protein
MIDLISARVVPYGGGPVSDKVFDDIDGVKTYVETHAPLLRGWTGKWVQVADDALIYKRYNSKGKPLPGTWDICVSIFHIKEG